MLTAALQPHNRTLPCAGASPLLANATSSASVLLYATKKCKAAPFEVLLRHEGSTEWTALSQWATKLPLEVGSLRCRLGCYLRLHSLDATAFAARLRSINHNATFYEKALNTSIMSDETIRLVTPMPEVLAPHPPATRLELMLRPPLPEPHQIQGSQWGTALAHTLYSPHFQLRAQRVRCPEVSSTGAFVQLDILPDDIYAYVSGPDTEEVLLELALRASMLNVSGHRIDARFGLWRQAVDGTKIHGAVVQKKLWPRQHSEDASSTAVAAAQAAAAKAPLRRDGDDDDDDGLDGDDERTYDTLDENELSQVLDEELYVEDDRSEPVLKGIVLFLSAIMVAAGCRQGFLSWRRTWRPLKAFGATPAVARAYDESDPPSPVGSGSSYPWDVREPRVFRKMDFAASANGSSMGWDPFSRLGYSMSL